MRYLREGLRQHYMAGYFPLVITTRLACMCYRLSSANIGELGTS
jgi:hypothetical protein